MQKKIVTIPISIDTNNFCIKQKVSKIVHKNFNTKKVMLFVGRLEKEKNVPFLLEVFKESKKVHKDITFLVIGDGRDKDSIEKKVLNENIKNVVFMGNISHDRLVDFYNISSVFCLASDYEGSPTVIKESIACGIPVVSVDVGDAKKVISDIPFCFISQRDIYDFSKKINFVLESKVNKNEIREHAKKYSNNVICELTYNLYKKKQG